MDTPALCNITAPRRLWNDDVLREIFVHLAPTSSGNFTEDDYPGLIALARCARSNSALFEPAVDVLWRQIDSLTAVFGVLSPAFRKVNLGKGSTKKYVLVGSVSHEAYLRLQFYASRVRRLARKVDAYKIELESVLEALYHHTKGEPLLPALESINWAQRTDTDIFDIIPLVSSSFRELSIIGMGAVTVGGAPSPRTRRLSRASHLFSSFVHELSSRAPCLKTLTLSGNIHSSSIICLGALKRLNTLSIINIAHHGFGSGILPVLRSCAGFHLEEFGINLTNEQSLDNLDITGFHSLHTLRVFGSIPLVTRFLSHVSSDHLTWFGAFVSRPDRWEDYRGCLDVLSMRFSSSLRMVWLSGPWTGNMASLACPLDILGPLLNLPLLEEIGVISETAVALSLSEANVKTITKAWPNLRDFRLLYQPARAALPIDALRHFVDGCPRLQTLWLASVDFRGVGERQLSVCPRNSRHSLVNIWLAGDARTSDVTKIALFVDRMFPHVYLGPIEPPYNVRLGLWDKIMAALREVKAARLKTAPLAITYASEDGESLTA